MKTRSTSTRAFTLLELLVAMAVLSLLVAIMLQIVALTQQAVNVNSQSLDASGQARQVFDRLAADLAARPKRNDLGVVFNKGSASDSLRFYSQVGGYSPNNVGGSTSDLRGTTAVGYRIQTQTPGRIYQLERGATASSFNGGTPLLFLPQTLSDADSTANDNPTTDYEVLASGVFRLEFCYLLNDGTLTIKTPASFSTVTAIVVAIGVLDAKSLQLLSSPATQLSQLSNALPKTTNGEDPLAQWNPAVDSLYIAGIPKPVLQNVRVYERTFYVQ